MGERAQRGEGPILVVDDDPLLLDALASILELEGHRVLQARDGPTAVRLTREHRPGLVVVDNLMQGMDGETVLGALRGAMRDEAPPALLLSATLEPIRRAERHGDVAGLEKPFNVAELLAAVEKQRRVRTPER